MRAAKKEFNKTEDDLKSLQSVGQIIGEVLRPLDNERCTSYSLNFFWNEVLSNWLVMLDYRCLCDFSDCQSKQWTKICCWMP